MNDVRALTLFDTTALPAYLADLNQVGNIVPRETVPQLSFRGKVWRVVVGGEETVVAKADGEPAQSVAVVILDYNKARSRAYYEGAYEEGKTTPPTCWSHDGVVPHPTVQHKQSATCATCPQSVKGSRVSDAGKELTACAQFKRVAVVPIQDTTFTPLLLKLPQTSMWDKDADEYATQGFYAYDQYMDMLKRRNVNHTALIVTKIKFDVRTAYPKLLFGAAAYVPEAQYPDITTQLAKTDELNKLLNVDPSGTEVAPDVAGDTGGEVAPPAPAPAPAPAVAKPTVAKPTPAPAKPVTKPTPAPAKPPEDEQLGLFGKAPAKPVAVPAPAAPAAPAAAAKPAQVVTENSPNNEAIAGLLASWDD